MNREDELKFLEKNYKEKKSNFIVIYGRRRVGKTELLLNFIKKQNGLYLLATQDVEKEIINSFSKTIADYYDDEALKVNPFFKFEQLIEYIQKKTKNVKEKLIMVIDEFPYLVNANNAISSIIQKYWDLYLKNHNIFLVLCGSSISFMETSVLGQKSPLYGRRTGQWKLEPLKFKDAKGFFPNVSIKKQIEFYCILGGIPFYLIEFEENKTSIENIFEHIAQKGKILYDEVHFILKEELREPKVYFSILREISLGKNRLNEICTAIGIERTSMTRYIQILESLDIIERIYPVTSKKVKTKKVRYQIRDNFFTFWFKFIHQYRSDLERKEYNNLSNYLKKELNSFIGKRFENVCKEFLMQNAPFTFTKVGKQWGKISNTKHVFEIDIVLLNEQTKEIAFFECKWKDVSYNQSLKLLDELKEKSNYVEWHNSKRKEHYGIIARKLDGKDKLRKKGLLVYDLDDWK